MKIVGNEVEIEIKTKGGWEKRRFVPKVPVVSVPAREPSLMEDQGAPVVWHSMTTFSKFYKDEGGRPKALSLP